MKFHRENTDESENENEIGEENADGLDYMERLRQKLIERGKKYREYCLKQRGRQIFDYDGFALSRGSGVRQVPKKYNVSRSDD